MIDGTSGSPGSWSGRMMRPQMSKRFNDARPALDSDVFAGFVASIDPDWIEEALTATGTATLRRRRLPANQVLWLVLAMALYRKRPIDELVERLDLVLPSKSGRGPARSGLVQARARLGDEPMAWLFDRCAREWGHDSARRHAWRGLALYGIDGSTVRAPDSEENRAHFGGPEGDRGPSGYPLVRIVTLMALRSHILAGASFGPYESEHVYAKPLWEKIPDDSLTIVDRAFFDAKTLIPHTRDGSNRHWLTRAKKSNVWTTTKSLGRGDRLVEFQVSSEARRRDPTLPKTWTVRAIDYQRKGFPPQTLLTSLLDPKAFPAKEVVALYHERWEIELGFREVKTFLLERQEALRSRKPTGVRQELWAVGLAYNLIRLEMERIAEEAGVQPTRISFRMAMRLIQDEWMWLSASSSPGAFPKHLRELREEVARFVLPERRSGRSFPRAVKIKMSSYNRKRPTSSRRAPTK
jgi:hypothetical protein